MSFCTDDKRKNTDLLADSIRVKDAFAKPRSISFIPTDPTQLLIDERKRRLLSFIIGGEVAEMSDYELFSAFVGNLSKMFGSAAREIFIEEIKLIYGEKYLIYLNDATMLWKELCAQMSFENSEFFKKLDAAKYYDKLNAIELVQNISVSDRYDKLISETISHIEHSNSEHAVLDISCFDFVRTDDFHAAKAYTAYIVGDKSALCESLSGALYPIMCALKKQKKTLLLNVGENYSSAEKMICYFKEREILPSTILFARGTSARRCAESLCGVYKTSKGEISIKCGVLYYEGETVRDIKARVMDIASVYSVGELFIGGALTVSPFVSARHMLLKCGVAEAIYEFSK